MRTCMYGNIGVSMEIGVVGDEGEFSFVYTRTPTNSAHDLTSEGILPSVYGRRPP